MFVVPNRLIFQLCLAVWQAGKEMKKLLLQSKTQGENIENFFQAVSSWITELLSFQCRYLGNCSINLFLRGHLTTVQGCLCQGHLTPFSHSSPCILLQLKSPCRLPITACLSPLSHQVLSLQQSSSMLFYSWLSLFYLLIVHIPRQ